MSVPARRRPARPARRNALVRPGLIALGLLLLLLVGISIGRALDDGPDPGGTVTNVRTLEPQPLPPMPRSGDEPPSRPTFAPASSRRIRR